MTKEEFEQLQQDQQRSGRGLMVYLKDNNISYSNYGYWRRKYASASTPAEAKLAPISIKEQERPQSLSESEISIHFPNGIRLSLPYGMEERAIMIINQYNQSHVLSE